jgi:hypothetical protein
MFALDEKKPPGSMIPAMPSTKGVVRPVNILRSHQEVGSTDRGVHSARIVSPNHGFDSLFIQNALGNLSIGGRAECRDGDQL